MPSVASVKFEVLDRLNTKKKNHDLLPMTMCFTLRIVYVQAASSAEVRLRNAKWSKELFIFVDVGDAQLRLSLGNTRITNGICLHDIIHSEINHGKPQLS